MKIKLKLMKTTKLIRYALFVAVLAAFVVGCEKAETYSIDAPSNLEDLIDSIADANEDQTSGDTTFFTIDTTLVGEDDYSTSWWTAWSDFFTVPAGKVLTINFHNYSTEEYTWDNWTLVLTNVEGTSTTDDESYSEYMCVRADTAGWGGTAYSADSLSWDYPDINGDGDWHDEFALAMTDASVTLTLDHSAAGGVYITATAVGEAYGEEATFVETYNYAGMTTDDIVAFLVCEGSYLEIEEAYLTTSTTTGDDVGSDDEDDTSSTTYRADITATTQGSDGNTYTMSYYVEGLTYSGYGSFLVTEEGYMVIDPDETYYCALADTATTGAWNYPYSEETTVGATDFSNAWWTTFSDYETVIGEGYFHYKFVNYTLGESSWQNWVLYLTNGYNRSSSNYAECLGLRADAWDNTNSTSTNITSDNGDDFLTYMNGATVDITMKVTAEDSSSTSSVGVGTVLEPGETIN